jgi:hypothetical protein
MVLSRESYRSFNANTPEEGLSMTAMNLNIIES